ncbi:LabA-like NYN domain-containing protein [Shewanella sp. cp20]|uniref:LabA-like NYN domain-containing protein n=1 Tax=Shewanella sp. cp20 TaxID=1521167 RepID=UPI0005A1E6C3|nr:NYN domain-containing protein [Shewanella sp. cp20]KIO36248.1 nuclease [Shewanella sp. cp20]
MKRIALFVDVQNIYYTCRQAYGRQFNYHALWQRLNEQGEIVKALAYAIDRGDDGQIKFQDALKHIGFEVKLKPFIQRSDGSAKGDWDVGITIDIMELAAEVDAVILLSGDGDFAMLLEHIASKHAVETQVFGVPELTAKALMDAATEFHPIDGELLR